MKELEDFTYDVSNIIKYNYNLSDNEYFDKFIKSYLFTHQFSESIEISDLDILGLFEYFLEEGEYIYENNNKLLFILNQNHHIDNVITFIKWVLKILSINITETSIINNLNNKIGLIISLKCYENTFNGERVEKLYMR